MCSEFRQMVSITVTHKQLGITSTQRYWLPQLKKTKIDIPRLKWIKLILLEHCNRNSDM